MKTYIVYLACTVSTSVQVEADSPEAAAESALTDPGRTLSLMFLDHQYPDEGEWDVTEVEEA